MATNKIRNQVIQVSGTARSGERLRLTQRLTGTEAEGNALRKRMKVELAQRLAELDLEHHQTQKTKEAAKTLGIDLNTQNLSASKQRPMLRDFLVDRWASHVQVVQGEVTRRTTKTHVAYICFYLGDRRIDQVDAAAFAKFREALIHDGPRSFFFKKNGQPRAPRRVEFTNTSVNHITSTLMAALRLAEKEGVIDRAPQVEMLPKDKSELIDPPTEEQFAALLEAAETFRPIAPFMPEAIKLAAWSGMRGGEQFCGLTWRCVDFNLNGTGALRIQMQPKTTMVDGKPWRPKGKTARIVPLMPELRDLLLDLRSRVPSGPDDFVIPSRGGAPYNRLESAPNRAGKGYFPDVAVCAGVKTTWHQLRHFFAVRALLASVPMPLVSRWLGHSDIQITVNRYGRFGAEDRKQFEWAQRIPSSAPKQLPATDADAR